MIKLLNKKIVSLILIANLIQNANEEDPLLKDKVNLSFRASIGKSNTKEFNSRLYLDECPITGWDYFHKWHKKHIEPMGRFYAPWELKKKLENGTCEKLAEGNRNILAASIGIIYERVIPGGEHSKELEIKPIDIPYYFINGSNVPPNDRKNFTLTDIENKELFEEFLLPEFHKKELENEFIEKGCSKHTDLEENKKIKIKNVNGKCKALNTEKDALKGAIDRLEGELKTSSNLNALQIERVRAQISSNKDRLDQIEIKLQEIQQDWNNFINQIACEKASRDRIAREYIAKNVFLDVTDSFGYEGAWKPDFSKKPSGYQVILAKMLGTLGLHFKKEGATAKSLENIKESIISKRKDGVMPFRFYDSEQGLFIYLSNLHSDDTEADLRLVKDNKESIDFLRKGIKTNTIKVKAALINVVSKNDTCPDCSLFYLCHSLFEGIAPDTQENGEIAFISKEDCQFRIADSIKKFLQLNSDEDITLFSVISSQHRKDRSEKDMVDTNNSCKLCKQGPEPLGVSDNQCDLCNLNSPTRQPGILKFFMRKFKWSK